MFGELADRALDQCCRSVGEVEPCLRREEETRLVGAVGSGLGEIEAGGSEASYSSVLPMGYGPQFACVVQISREPTMRSGEMEAWQQQNYGPGQPVVPPVSPRNRRAVD